MEFNFRGFDTARQYNHVFPATSSSNYTYFSEPAVIYGLWSGRRVGPVDMREDVHNGVGFPSPVVLRQPVLTNHQFAPEMLLHGESFSPDNVTVALPLQERYGGGGYPRRDIGEFEAVPVPFQRQPPSPEIKTVIRYQPKDFKREFIVSGKPTSAPASGSKRKAPPPMGPQGFCSNDSKKIIEEWKCAVCDISATCERGLSEHLAGKKHQTKVQSLKRDNTGGDIGLGVITTSAKKQKSEIKSLKGNNVDGDIGLGITSVSVDTKKGKMSTDGGKVRRKFKFWCKICQIGAHDEKVMSEHKKGRKHRKNRRKKAKAKTSGRKKYVICVGHMN